jgi:hypothetical protein
MERFNHLIECRIDVAKSRRRNAAILDLAHRRIVQQPQGQISLDSQASCGLKAPAADSRSQPRVQGSIWRNAVERKRGKA